METNRRLASLEANILQLLDTLKSHPENFVEQSEIRATSLSSYSEEAKATAWYQRLVQSLYYPRFQSRHDAISIAHSKTFEWMLSDIDVPWKKPWMEFLWHHNSTREHLEAWSGTNRLTTASYFFWAAGDELQRSEEGLMRALLFEILRACPSLNRGIRDDFNASADFSQQPHAQLWTYSNLLRMFDVVMNQEFEAMFCFFIDGLDEYKGNTRGLVELVQKLVSYPSVKICLSSRPWAAFRHAFGEDANVDWHISLEELTKEDIRQYFNGQLNSSIRFSVLGNDDVGYFDIVEQVMLRAEGVFLWVVLAVRSLLEGVDYNDNIADMRRRLDAIPEDLDDFFRKILNDIPEFYRTTIFKSQPNR
ncbi:uncharacterized protein PG986_000754 [Apiospora aurea]|uniref:Nephrocystin 3-like N-terminal domain-containing protein n=1 Tax=Apiospora aurea TaxID=335848 RepID=A0ABR1QUX3_9PEZI